MKPEDVRHLDLMPISKRGKQIASEFGVFVTVNSFNPRMPCFNHEPGFNVTFSFNGRTHTRNIKSYGDRNFTITRLVGG